VVTYEMVYWDGKAQPDVATQWGELRRFQAASGHRNFSFTVGTMPLTLDQLLTDVRRHFFAIVQHGKACRSRDEGIDRMLGMNTADQHVNVTSPQKAAYRVFDVHHVETIRINTQKDHFVDSRKLRYHCEVKTDTEHYVMDDKFISASMDYTDNRMLFKRALGHLQCDETLAMIKKVDNQSMV